MTHLRTWACLAALMALLGANACHAQKTTIDPNAGGAAKPADVELTDARLSKKLSYEAWHTPLNNILAEISESTGVTLNAGYSRQDWQVRDRKMNIYVKDVTLAQLMNSIARVMKFKWSRNDESTPPTYRLAADRSLLAALQAEAGRLERELKAEEVRRRTGTVEALAKVADLSGHALEALREDNPYLYQCASTGFAKAMTQIFAEEPSIREAFVNGNKTAGVEASLFSPSTRQFCADNVRGNWPLDHVTQNRSPVPDGFESDFAKDGGVHFDWLNKPYEHSLRKRLFYFGYIVTTASDGARFMGDMRDPYAESSKAWGKACLEAVEDGREPGEHWSNVAPHYFPTEYEEAKQIESYLMFDPTVEHPDEPDLHKKITLVLSDEEKKALIDEAKAAGYRTAMRLVYQALQKAVARAADMSIVSDSYNVVQGLSEPRIPDDIELIIVLDKMTDTYRCNWEKHGSILEFRRRDWFRRRASQVPDEWLEQWRKELEKECVLGLESYIRIVALSQDQLEESVTIHPVFEQAIGADHWESSINKGFCRFYVQLTENQRAMLFSEPGLDARTFNPTQWQYYSDMFELGWQPRWHTEEFSSPGDAIVTIKGASQTKDDGSATCKFTVHLTRNDGSSDKQVWTINLCKISKPKETTK